MAAQVPIELDPSQRAAVESDAAPLLVLAGPGTGKTEVLTQRVARRSKHEVQFDPRRVLIATFTRYAAQELRKRLFLMQVRDLGQVGTFHSIALRQIREYEQSRNIGRHAILSNRRALIKELLFERRSWRGWRGEPGSAGANATSLNWTCSEVDWACARGITPESYRDEYGPDRSNSAQSVKALTDLFSHYVATKKERKLLDFDDVLVWCRQLVENDAQFSAQQRWSFRHFFVDEFQDMNPLQFRLLQAWLGDRADLFAVGDPNQSIYGWNGAEPAYLTDFAAYFPGATILRLTLNRRSTPDIVNAAEAALSAGSAGGTTNGIGSIGGTTNSTSSTGDTTDDTGDTNDTGSGQLCFLPEGEPPTFSSFANAQAEAEGIAALLQAKRGAVSGRKDNWAVLARTNAQLRKISEVLDHTGIAHKLSGMRSLLDRPEATHLLEELTTSWDLATAVRDRLIERDNPITDNDTSIADSDDPLNSDQTDSHQTNHRQTDSHQTDSPQTNHRLTDNPQTNHRQTDNPRQFTRARLPRQTRQRRDQTDRVKQFTRAYNRVLELAQQYIGERASNPTGDGFRYWLSELTPYDIDPTESSMGVVDLVTFHAAKGLQWRNVVIAGMNVGQIPANRGNPEENRLLYVALTRAKHTLHFTWSEATGRSPWLDTIKAISAGKPPVTKSEMTRGLTAARAALAAVPTSAGVSACDSGGSSGLLSPTEIQRERRAQLEQWRTRTARTRRVELGAVMSDKVLSVISRNGLSTLDALARATGDNANRWTLLFEDIREQLPMVLVDAELTGEELAAAAEDRSQQSLWLDD